MKYYAMAVCAALATITCTYAVEAQDVLEINPGRYSINKSTETNYDSEPQLFSDEKCITDSAIDPRALLPDKEKCRVENVKKGDNSISFNYACSKKDEFNAINGEFSMVADDDSFTYQFKQHSTINEDKPLVITSKGNGDRLGQCGPETPSEN